MSKKDTKTVFTTHSKFRFTERIGSRSTMEGEVKKAKRYGIMHRNIPNDPKYTYLFKYLKYSRIYYNGHVFVFNADNYYQLRTCFPAPASVEKLGEEATLAVYGPKEEKVIEPKRTNLFCSACNCYFSVITKQGKISYVYVGRPKMEETSKASFAAYLEKDFLGYMSKGNPLDTQLDFSDYSDFEISVYKAVCKIPFGKTITYGDLAKQFNTTPMNISRILNKCNLVLAVPTHRVISTRNRIGTYKYSRDCNIKDYNRNIKYRLLRMEGSMD